MATATVLVLCIFGALAFLLLVKGGQSVMCRTHGNTLAYCSQVAK